MSSYGSLAAWYDRLTGDVPYSRFADLYEREFRRMDGPAQLVLDLCCGTGTLTALMAQRGYEMIGVDASEDMLMQAREKAQALSPTPLLLCQDAAELDLYGTVDAAYCSLDGINYLSPASLPELFRRLRLFIRPKGLFIFDIRSVDWLLSMDGSTYVDESEDLLCLWRADYDRDSAVMTYGMDLFSREGKLWRRSEEEHTEYGYSFETLKTMLETAGFAMVHELDDAPQTELGRQFISALRI